MQDDVEFTGFDRPRRLRVDVNSVSAFEDITGMSIFEVLNAERMRITTIRTLLFATMKQDDKRLTIERVGQMMNDYLAAHGGDLQALADALIDAVVKSRLIAALSGRDPNAATGPTETTTPPASANGSASD